MTKLNEQILEMIKQNAGHLNADEVFKLAKKKHIDVSLASVYRILTKLSEEGYIRKITMPGEPDVFDHSTKNHAHYICDVCGCIKDVMDPTLDKKIEDQLSPDAKYDLLIHYVCKDCQRKTKKKEK